MAEQKEIGRHTSSRRAAAVHGNAESVVGESAPKSDEGGRSFSRPRTGRAGERS